ncbi:hypothetical protein BDZ91DRAFT_710117 [Kalaharituber pfeilii]|nr:hypothetical protein BDZ91DRAFT_710117 [Kalaharituber pfeilii]
MSTSQATENSSNLTIFRDCLAPVIYRKFTSLTEEDSSDISDLAEFIEYLSHEVFLCIPASFQRLEYTGKDASAKDLALDLSTFPIHTIPTSFTDSLISYGLVGDEEDAEKLLMQVMEVYVSEATKPPPVWVSTRKAECEICERNVPLTYHHLIPKSTHTKVLKRGWHPEHMLNSVAWICRPCHTMCHKVADNETLAKDFFTVERLLAREDIQRWAAYQSRQKWGMRRG